MARFLLILVFLFGAFHVNAQAPTVANLSATGTNVKWYAALTGGSALATSTVLKNGDKYYASQTVNGVESSNRFEVTVNLASQTAPTEGSHTATQTQVIWNWSAATGATGYKWGSTNVYANATDLGNTASYTETGLTCNTAYTRYGWAYNSFGCASSATALTQTTSSCVNLPTVTTTALTLVYSNSCSGGGEVTNDGGASVTERGVCWSTAANPNQTYSPSTADGTGIGAFTSRLTQLTPNTTYHVRAFARNSAGIGYGSDLTVKTMNGVTFNYTGAYETWVVPAGVTTMIVEAWGADGGGGTGWGGMGGYTKGRLTVSAGTTYYIYVGEQPTAQTGGWNGGGTGGLGGSFSTSTNHPGLGGGGATDIRTTAGNLGSRILVAGGAGGVNDMLTWMSVGSGGGTTGGYAASNLTNIDAKGGFGGTQSAGGAAGSTLRNATAGALGVGGNGSGGYLKAMGGGGGGGGYYGGGGGSSVTDVYLSNTGWGGGGGGGSSYIHSSFTETSNLQGKRAGHGMVIIHY